MTTFNIMEFKDSIKSGLFDRAKYIVENAEPIIMQRLTENMSEHPWTGSQQIPFLSKEDFVQLMMNWSVVEDPNFEGNFGSTIKGPETLDFSTINAVNHGQKQMPTSLENWSIDPVLASADVTDLLNMAYALDESEIEDYYDALVEDTTPTINVSLDDNTSEDENDALASLNQALQDGTVVRLLVNDGTSLDLDQEHIQKLVDNPEMLKAVLGSLDSIEQLCSILGIQMSDDEPDDSEDNNQDDDSDEQDTYANDTGAE